MPKQEELACGTNSGQVQLVTVNGERRCKCYSSAQLDLSKTRCITKSDDCGEGGKVDMKTDYCYCKSGYAKSLDGRSCVMLKPCGNTGVVGTDGHCVCASGLFLLNGACTVECPTGYIQKDDSGESKCVCDVENGYVASLDGTNCVLKTSLSALHQVALAEGKAACATGFATSVDLSECVDVLGGCGLNEKADTDEGACVCARKQLVISLNESVCVPRAQCVADANALDYPLYCECGENSRFHPGKDKCMKTVVTSGVTLSTEPLVEELCLDEGQACQTGATCVPNGGDNIFRCVCSTGMLVFDGVCLETSCIGVDG